MDIYLAEEYSYGSVVIQVDEEEEVNNIIKGGKKVPWNNNQ